jgi:acyl-CoA thioester hydrolase
VIPAAWETSGVEKTPTPPPVFERTLTVAAGDLDAQGHVNNVVFVRWVEETAICHWTALTTPEVQAEVGWVLLRHEIDYLRPVGLGEVLTARTWLAELGRMRVDRRVEFLRPTGEVVASSRTVWCPVDPGTGRPRRVGDDLRTIFAEPVAP